MFVCPPALKSWIFFPLGVWLIQQAHTSSITYNSLKLLKFSNVQKVPGHPGTTSTTLEVTGMSRMSMQTMPLHKKKIMYTSSGHRPDEQFSPACSFVPSVNIRWVLWFRNVSFCRRWAYLVQWMSVLRSVCWVEMFTESTVRWNDRAALFHRTFSVREYSFAK